MRLTATDVLKEFVRDIEDSGGVRVSENGTVEPEADPTWSDLGATYLRACEVLGKEPMIIKDDEDEEEEGE